MNIEAKGPWRTAFAAAAGLTVAAGALVMAPLAAADDTGTWDNPKLVITERCEGTTEHDPTEDMTYLEEAGGPVNLLGLWGERYEAYERGDAVPLYSNDGTGGNLAAPPLCVVEKGEDGHPMTSWTYCTDEDKAVCGSYDLEGNITDMVQAEGKTAYPVGGQVPNNEPNNRLSVKQQRVLAFLLSNEVAIPKSAFDWSPEFVVNEVAEASNDSTLQRQARQFMTWCVTDPVDYGWWDEDAGKYWYEFCEQAMPVDLQDQFAKAVEDADSAALKLTVSPEEVTVGDAAQVTVTTSMLRVPLDLTVSDGATITVAEGSGEYATVAGNTLTVDTPNPVTLNLTSNTEGDYAVTVAGIHPQTDQLSWAQSQGAAHDDKACQIYSHFTATDPQKLSAAGTVKFTPVPREDTLVAPVVPEVNPAQCATGDEGATIWETVTEPADTDEITYQMSQQGNVVTIVATPTEGHALQDTEGWTLNEDKTATWIYELQSETCATPTQPEKPGETPEPGETPNGDELPKTGVAGGLALLGVALTAGGTGLLTARRKR